MLEGGGRTCIRRPGRGLEQDKEATACSLGMRHALRQHDMGATVTQVHDTLESTGGRDRVVWESRSSTATRQQGREEGRREGGGKLRQVTSDL